MNLVLRLVLLVGAVAFFLIGLMFKAPTILLTSVVLIFFHNIIYVLKDFYKNIIFFCFNITFFVFLISRMVVTGFFGYKKESSGIFGLNFNEVSTVITINTCLFLSLIAVFIGYVIAQKVDFRFLDKKGKTNVQFLQSLRTFSLVFFLFSVGVRYIYLFQVRKVVVNHGYYDTFLTVKTSLPSPLVTISAMFEVAFFAYLSTMPSKRKSLIPVGLYLGAGFLSALGGGRSNFILSILIVLVYFCIRSLPDIQNKIKEIKGKREKKWMGKFEWLLGIISFPFLMLFMTVIGYFRAGVDKETGFLQGIYEFFFSQGVSANVIGYTKRYADSIPDKLYTFGPIVEFIDNRIIRPLTGESALLGQSMERALDGFSFTHTISYLIMPDMYLQGRGYGSSFVAELFNDFSYIGVFIGSIVFGGIIYLFYYMLKNSNFFLFICTMLMTKSLFFTPRDQYFSFLADAFPARNLAAIVFIIIGAKLLQSVIGSRRISFSLR